MAARKPLKIPARYLKEDTPANRKEIRKLITERIDYNRAQRPPLPFRDGLPVGKFNIGDTEVTIGSVTQYTKGKGNPTLDTVGDTGKVREGSLLKQTSKTGAVKKTQYGRGARGLAEGMQDHHIRFRTLFEPFYEGLNEKDARELTEWFVQGKSPLGNVVENLEGVDADLHSELERSIHQWAKENQLQVDAFSKEEWRAGARNIDPKTGLVRGGADSELFIDPKKGMVTLKAEGARPIPKAKFPNLSHLDLNERKNAARLYLDIHEEPLLNKTAEILEEQDLRYAAKDPNYKPKTKTQWLQKWDESATAGAKTSEWLEDVAEKNPNLDIRMSDIDDILADPDAPLSKAAVKRLKIKPSRASLKLLKRVGVGALGLPLIGGGQGYAAGMYQKTGDKKYLKDLGIATGRDFLTGATMSGIGHVGSKVAQTGVGKLAIKQAGKGLLKQSLIRGGLGIGARGALGAAVPVLGWGLLAYSAYDMANQYAKATTGQGLIGHAKDNIQNLLIKPRVDENLTLAKLQMQRLGSLY